MIIFLFLMLFCLDWVFCSSVYRPIVVIYNPDLYDRYKTRLFAFKQALKEEGVNFEVLSIYKILSDNSLLLKNKSLKGLIFPDGINQYVPDEMYFIVKRLLNGGVNIFISYDAGVKTKNNRYLRKSVFSDLLKINYITYEDYGEGCYLIDQIEILDPKFLGFPEYKLDRGLIVGYKYPIKKYYASRANIEENSFTVLARTKEHKIPFIVIKNFGKGNIYYVNTPLGYLKANSDDLILRINLRAFLYRVCKVNHILNLYNGIPTIIINYHVDANSDWKAIEFLYSNNYLRRSIRSSFHITAGDFRDKEGDKLGFDACGKGRNYVKLLSKFGEIGSHGGWAHNYFSYTILYHPEKVNLSQFITENIKKNNRCLESIVGYRIVEYSAPNGIYPQPINTKVLEMLGMICYYYVGDLWSQPNLTFFDNQMVSDKVLAFPVISYKTIVSLGEMSKRKVSNSEVRRFLRYILDYVTDYDTVRLYYTHPYDILVYPREYYYFIDYLDKLVSNRVIQIQTMKEYTEFFFRFLKTRYDIIDYDNYTLITLENPISLKGITLRICEERAEIFTFNRNYFCKKGIEYRHKGGNLYLTVTSDKKYVQFILRKKQK
ncbi:MAG: hypothetical protein ABDH21_06445 [bacterium]